MENNIRQKQLINRLTLNIIKVLRIFLFYPSIILFLNWSLVQPFNGNNISYFEGLTYTIVLTAFYNLTTQKKQD